MAKLTFYPDNITIDVPNGTTILEAARLAGVVIESPCNAVATCGKCKVKLNRESRQNVTVKQGKHRLSQQEESAGLVLSCQAEVTGDIEVEVISLDQNHTLKVLSHGQSFDIEIDGYIWKEFRPDENITYVFAGNNLLGTEQGNTEAQSYGIVVDIGTTTLVTSLVDLHSGEEITSTSSLNPQSLHAQDVLSRIKFASDEQGLDVMYSAIINEVNRMTDVVVATSGVNKANIYEVIFSGNTCMLHLAANVNPYSLGKYPYTPQVTGGSHLRAAEHGLHIAEFGLVYLPPIVSSYVGADITSGILASRLHDQTGVTLFVDIGTNGEMVIGLDGRLSATSTAAGPAFEGMNITHGMRAGNGAIELFDIRADGTVQVKTIGSVEAVGICGSGLLDIVGELVAFGVINKNGKLVDPEKAEIRPDLKERLVKREGKTVFKITDNVYLSQKDVRQVQLAKGAIRAGIEFLLRSKGIKASEVDRVMIAGSFGYHLRAKSLINIGLLPAEFAGRIEFVGNTSKTGGQAFLLNKNYRAEIEQLVEEIEVLDLASYKDFDKVFVNCLGF